MTSQSSGQLFTVPAKLGIRQEIVYAIVEPGWPMGALQVGKELHRRRGCHHCKPGFPCQYAESDAHDVLESLRKRGLLKRDRHHIYRRATEQAAISPVLTPEEEFGF